MKKIVFTIQVFVLIAMFPVYLVVELNLETGRSTANNSTLEFKEEVKENNIQPASGHYLNLFRVEEMQDDVMRKLKPGRQVVTKQ